MKILHVAQSLKGGPASYFDEIIPHQICKYGADNIVLVVPADDLQYLSAATLKANVHAFPTRKRAIIPLLQFAVLLAQAQNQTRPDIVHLHSTYAGAIGRLINLPSLRRPKIIYCAHGWAFERNGKGSVSGGAVVLTERLLAAITDQIVNLSEFDQLRTDSHGIAPGRTTIIENAISPRPLHTHGKDPGRRALGLHANVTNLLFVGRLDRQKGVDIVIDIMKRLSGRPFHLSLIGQWVTDADQDLPLSANITHHPWMPRHELLQYYEASDVLLMPSRWEGLPLTLLEAMRSALPVLASNRSALPYVVENGVTGHVSPELTAGAFTDILLRTTADEWQRMGLAGRKKYELHYTSDILCAALDELYSNVTRKI